MTITATADGLEFCHALHERLAVRLADVDAIRSRVKMLRSQNSFQESCFCKGCVLPVVDSLATQFLGSRYGASRYEVHQALRCEGFDTPMYACDESQVGFSSHSRSNSYHPGDKSGRRAQSRRSPDFCIRFASALRLVGELKYLPAVRASDVAKVAHELRDYLSIQSEPTSDWGHDVGFGLLFSFGGDELRTAASVLDYWESDRIFITCLT
jgi:hypothetical protein